jgi:hypothetical protein
MIVNLTRDDLRDEFAMADEAFALSPISARAAQPREEDYDAISAAFMETSRGRWFLGEYAKRNRNADTRMVLDAVARIEETLAAQRQPPPENVLPEALAAIRSALDEARAAAAAAIGSLALEENLAPVRKGARVIREIAWRWREIGADSRICDLIESQVSAIEAGYGQISSEGPRGALSAAFDLIEARIAAFGDSDEAPLKADEEAATSPAPAASDEVPAAVAEKAQTAAATNDAEVAINTEALPPEAAVATAEADDVTAEAVDLAAATADAMIEAADVTVEAADVTAEAPEAMAEAADAEAADAQDADAQDEALLDLIALEMAAPDPSYADDASETYNDETLAEESPPAGPIIIAERPEPVATPERPRAIEPSRQPSLQASPEPSLGSTLLANGVVRRPKTGSDPLAPIRRLSQAEKIALFS